MEVFAMAAEKIGVVNSKIGNSYEVKYDRENWNVYVSYAGWMEIGKAPTVELALKQAEVFLATK